MDTAFTKTRPRITRFECGEPELVGATVRLPYAATGEDGAGYSFTEEIVFPGDVADGPVAKGLIRLLSLSASLSYYKAFAPVPLPPSDSS